MNKVRKGREKVPAVQGGAVTVSLIHADCAAAAAAALPAQQSC